MKDHVDSRGCNSFQELQDEIDRYIKYYNHHRYQWGLKKMTPVQYEATEELAILLSRGT
ncbi:IS3 family transposase [Paenibacillus sp. FSL H7-0331]|uniref:IS3 family transposase n=1 Tax=Paenibacillus sp. FSL H7-0331 TaxID=1920421 RepID=UPI0040469E37